MILSVLERNILLPDMLADNGVRNDHPATARNEFHYFFRPFNLGLHHRCEAQTEFAILLSSPKGTGGS